MPSPARCEGTPKPKLQMLCHYQNIAAWRRPPGRRSGPAARVWLDGAEVADIYARFAAVQLTPEPVIDISGASGVTLMLAMAHRRGLDRPRAGARTACPAAIPWHCRAGRLDLDLPAGLDRDGRHRLERPLRGRERPRRRCRDGHARYTGRLHERLKAESPTSRPASTSRDLEQVWQAMVALRDRMLKRAGLMAATSSRLRTHGFPRHARVAPRQNGAS